MTEPAPDFEQLLTNGNGVPTPRPTEPRGSSLDAWWQSRMTTVGARHAWQIGVPVAVTALAAFTRLVNLGHPRSLVFDETFYVKDAWSLVNLGYSSTWPADADAGFATGNIDTYTAIGSYVVHPPLGKWLIGAGMALFGPENPASWRAATAIAGILAVLLLFFIARSLLRSTLLGGIAGGLMAIDGNAIVMSRVALLDNFVMLFALAGFGAILLDRRWSARRLDAWVMHRHKLDKDLDLGPVFWWRPWLLAAGLAFGLTAAVKWNGLYFLAAFAVYTLVVDMFARRRVGVTFWFTGTVLRQGPVSFLLAVPIALAAYLASWASWFSTEGGYDRRWAETVGNAATGALSWIPLPIQSWWHYQTSVYAYHVGEMRPHDYQANPLTWLFMVRPTSMFYQADGLGQNGCLADQCGSSITGLANPIIWWAATAAVFYLVYRLARYREWRVGLVLMGMAAGYLPWLLYLQRTVFQFYTIAFEPYLILALTLAIGILLGKPTDPTFRRAIGLQAVGIFLAVAVAASLFFWPLWTGMQIDYEYMRAHWWLPSWV